MNIPVKPPIRAGRVVIILGLIVFISLGIFLYQGQVSRRQGLVGKWESETYLGGKRILTIAADGTLVLDGKKGTWNYVDEVVTIKFEGTGFEYKLFAGLQNELDDHIPEGSNFTKVSP